jgi:endonuclease III
MAATINKQKVLTHLFSALKKHKDVSDEAAGPVMEQLLYGICREDATREQADAAFQGLRDHFFDWNEIRVSSAHEVAEALGDLSDAERRAERIIALLQEVFEATFSFDLESMHKKGVKMAVKSLARYQGVNEFTTSWVVQHSLGGHAVPLDRVTIRVVQRLGLIDRDQEDREAMRTSLEHLVPKAKGQAFGDFLSYLGHEFCHEDGPRCGACPLSTECPTGQESAAAATATRSRQKPR